MVKPGGRRGQPGVPPAREPVLAVLVVGLHPPPAAGRRAGSAGGRAWFEVGRFLGPNISAHYRRYPLAWTVGGVGTGRLRGRRGAPDEPGRRPGDVGTSRRWVSEPGRGRRRDARRLLRRPDHRRLARLVDPAPPALHRLAPLLRGHRRLPGTRGRHHPPAGHAPGLLLRRGAGRPRPRRAPRTPAAHPDPLRRPRCRDRGRAGRGGGPGGGRRRPGGARRWCPSWSSAHSW